MNLQKIKNKFIGNRKFLANYISGGSIISFLAAMGLDFEPVVEFYKNNEFLTVGIGYCFHSLTHAFCKTSRDREKEKDRLIDDLANDEFWSDEEIKVANMEVDMMPEQLKEENSYIEKKHSQNIIKSIGERYEEVL